VSALVAVAAALVALSWLRPRRAATRLARAVDPPTPSSTNHPRTRLPPLVLVAGAGVGAMVAVASGVGWLLAVAVIAVVLRRRQRPANNSIDAVGLSLEVAAACLEAGTSTAEALRAAGSASADRGVAERFAAAAGAVTAGAPVASAWRSWPPDRWFDAVARSCDRSAVSGAAIAAELRRIAQRLRSTARTQRLQQGQRAATLIVLPLGLCFLPAFVLVGVAPLVLSLLPRLA
jgi:pilus assembly protein TadC